MEDDRKLLSLALAGLGDTIRAGISPTQQPTFLPAFQERQASETRRQDVLSQNVLDQSNFEKSLKAQQEQRQQEFDRQLQLIGIKAGLESGKQAAKGLTGETAGKFAAIQQAESDLGEIKGLLFKNGKLNKRLVAQQTLIPNPLNILTFGQVGSGNVPMGTDARKVDSAFRNALEAKLRIETGAAANQGEINRLMQRFGIGILDSDESALFKFNRLEEFMKNAKVTIDPAGRFSYKTGNRDVDAIVNATDGDMTNFILQAKSAGHSEEEIQKFITSKLGGKDGK